VVDGQSAPRGVDRTALAAGGRVSEDGARHREGAGAGGEQAAAVAVGGGAAAVGTEQLGLHAVAQVDVAAAYGIVVPQGGAVEAENAATRDPRGAAVGGGAVVLQVGAHEAVRQAGRDREVEGAATLCRLVVGERAPFHGEGRSREGHHGAAQPAGFVVVDGGVQQGEGA